MADDLACLHGGGHCLADLGIHIFLALRDRDRDIVYLLDGESEKLHILSTDEFLFLLQDPKKRFLGMFGPGFTSMGKAMFNGRATLLIADHLLTLHILENEFGKGPGSIVE